jgi:hypothetical protein
MNFANESQFPNLLNGKDKCRLCQEKLAEWHNIPKWYELWVLFRQNQVEFFGGEVI